MGRTITAGANQCPLCHRMVRRVRRKHCMTCYLVIRGKYERTRRPCKLKPDAYRVRFDANGWEEFRKLAGPGTALPAFPTLQEARDYCTAKNRELNELYGVPDQPPFPIFFVESGREIFHLTEEQVPV